MRMPQHYSKAPIAEAVISLRVDPSPGLDSSVFQQLANRLVDYPKRLPIKGLQMGFSAADTPSPQFHSKHEDLGLRLETADGRRVLQLQKHEFTFSHLPPYSNWQEFVADGRPLWPLFVSATGATAVTRAAVRVINKLEIPGPIADLPLYVNLLPALPRAMPSPPDTFFMQFQLSLDKLAEGCRAIVNVASGSQPDRDTTNLLLDFDLFVQGPLKVDDAIVWPLLERLSEGKNQLFEACITDKTRALIQ